MRVNVTALRIDPEDLSKLESLALRLGITWGEKGNVSGLMRAIASEKLIVLRKEELEELRSNNQLLRDNEKTKLLAEVMEFMEKL